MAYDLGQTCMLVNIGLSRSECASWVQAWGSVLAILMSGLIAWYQIRAARHATLRAHRERGLAMIESIAQLARTFSLQMASAAEAFSPSYEGGAPLVRRGYDPFKNLESAIQAVQLHDLPDAESVRLLIAFRNLVATSNAAIERLMVLLEDIEWIPKEPLGALLLAAQEQDASWQKLVQKHAAQTKQMH